MVAPTRASGVRKPSLTAEKLGKALQLHPRFPVCARRVVGLLSGPPTFGVKTYFENSASLQKSESELKRLLVILCFGRRGAEDL